MSTSDKLNPAHRFEIEAYKKPKHFHELIKTHVPFSGSPQRHPFDSEKVFLFVDPYSTHTAYYEFNAADISYLEELPSIVNLDGKAILMVRLWVKKLSLGLRCTPFVVADTRKGSHGLG